MSALHDGIGAPTSGVSLGRSRVEVFESMDINGGSNRDFLMVPSNSGVPSGDYRTMTFHTIAAIAEVDTEPVRDLLDLAIGPGRHDRLLTEVNYYLTGPATVVGAYDGDVLIGVLGFLIGESRSC